MFISNRAASNRDSIGYRLVNLVRIYELLVDYWLKFMYKSSVTTVTVTVPLG